MPKKKQSNAAASFAQFTLFPKLPVELRLMIWALSLPNQQTIRIASTGDYPGLTRIIANKDVEFFPKASYKIPALLHVNQESRHLAQRIYKPAFMSQLNGNGVYFDFEKDTLHLEGFNTFVAFFGVRKLIRFLGLDMEENEVQTLANKLVFPCIRSLSFMIGPEDPINISILEYALYLSECSNLEKIYICGSPIGSIMIPFAAALNATRKTRVEEAGSSYREAQVYYLNPKQREKLIASKDPLELPKSRLPKSITNPTPPTRRSARLQGH